MKKTLITLFISLLISQICLAEDHTITITDNLEQNGWLTQMSKTYYRDDATNWISNVVKTQTNSSDESTVPATIILNCTNLGNKDKKDIQPTISLITDSEKIDKYNQQELKFEIGTKKITKITSVLHNKLALNNATDVIELIYRNHTQKMIVYFDANNFSVFDLSGMTALIPDLIECMKQ